MLKKTMTIGQFRFTCLLIFMNILLPLYQASTFVRWGKTSCPGTGTTASTKVYDGSAAGNKFNAGGSGANYLCMHKTPEWARFRATTVWMGSIWGAKYGINNHEPYSRNFNNADMPCVVCENARPNILMIPGKMTCAGTGWTQEYTGYIMSAYSLSPSARSETEYICVDETIEKIPNSNTGKVQSMVYPTVAECGTLRCPSYQQHRQLTCVVCSK